MRRINWYWFALNSIFLIVFNVFFYMLRDASKHHESAWISYGFIHFAYFMLLVTPFFISKGAFSANYNRPLFLISSLYFWSVLMVGRVFIGIKTETSTTWLVEVVLLGVFAIWFISNLIANKHTANTIETHEQELQYVKITSSQLKSIMHQITDSKTNKQVEKLYDYIHSSPIKSSPCVFEIEQNIMHEIDNLFNPNHFNDNTFIFEITNKILQMAIERNRLLKLLN